MEALRAFERETRALGEIMGRLGWDQETVMPRGAAPQRAEEMAALESVLHARRTDPRVGDWLAAAEPATEADRAELREIRKSYDRAVKVPARLASEIARVTSRAQGQWAEGPHGKRFSSGFAPCCSPRSCTSRTRMAQAIAGDRASTTPWLKDLRTGRHRRPRSARCSNTLRPRPRVPARPHPRGKGPPSGALEPV